jgi:hypothetical protein
VIDSSAASNPASGLTKNAHPRGGSPPAAPGLSRVKARTTAGSENAHPRTQGNITSQKSAARRCQQKNTSKDDYQIKHLNG